MPRTCKSETEYDLCTKCETRNKSSPKAPYDYYFCIWCLKNGKGIGENGANEVSHHLNPICNSCAWKKKICAGCKCQFRL